ncbi:MAG: STAS domain-containing protein [Mycobacterium sp.]
MQLEVDHDTLDEAVVVRVEGDIDSSSAEELTSYLTTALSMASGRPARLLVIDLQGVSFFGSAGLNAVLGCHERGAANGTAVRLVASQPEVIRPIEVTQLDNVLKLYSSLTEAAAPQTQP